MDVAPLLLELYGRIPPLAQDAVEGVSLAAADVLQDRFSVALIPITLRETTLGSLRVDDRVNLESDLFVKSARELRAAARLVASRSFAALPWAGERRIAETMTKLSALPIDIRLAPEQVGFSLAHCNYGDIAGLPVLNVFEKPLSEEKLMLKRIEDVAIAAALLVLREATCREHHTAARAYFDVPLRRADHRADHAAALFE